VWCGAVLYDVDGFGKERGYMRGSRGRKNYKKEGKKLRKLYILTHSSNERAQAFYRKSGFTETGKTGDFFGSIIYEYIKRL